MKSDQEQEQDQTRTQPETAQQELGTCRGWSYFKENLLGFQIPVLPPQIYSSLFYPTTL